MTTFKEIEETHRRVHSPETQNLSVNQLKSLLKELRDLECNPKYSVAMGQISEAEKRVVRLITENTQWYSKPLGIIFLGVCGIVLGACLLWVLGNYAGIEL